MPSEAEIVAAIEVVSNAIDDGWFSRWPRLTKKAQNTMLWGIVRSALEASEEVRERGRKYNLSFDPRAMDQFSAPAAAPRARP